jgi:hypothetical protein
MRAVLSQQLDLAETAAQAAERAKKELERVTEEVERVARQLEELRVIQKFTAHGFSVLSKSRDDLNAAIARQKRILHPIRQLPDELLAQIFRTFWRSLEDDYLDEDTWRGSLRCLFLGAVCQRWRTVAQSTREIWTGIPLSLQRPSRAVISTHLARLAQGQDLEIMINDVEDDETNPSQALHAFLCSIEPLSVSIASLFLRFHSPDGLHILEKWSFPAHSVEVLSITTITSEEPGIVPAVFLQHFRNLSTLNLCDTTLAPDIILTPVDALYIYSESSSLSPEALCQLCRQLPSLEMFYINTSGIEESYWPSPGQGLTVQTSLKQLQIHLGDLASAAIALRTCIEVPQLETLYCTSIGFTTNPDFVEEFICKLEPLRSLCCLSFLCGNDGTVKEQEDSLNALGRLPYIEHIEFDTVDLGVFSRIVTNLCAHMDSFQTSDADASTFFPKLHTLSFIKLPTVPFREILRLVERRNAFASQYPEKCSEISEVTLKDSDWWSKEDYDRLRNLLGPGGVIGNTNE